MLKYFLFIVLLLGFTKSNGQNILDSYLIPSNNILFLRGDSSDGLNKPRDLDFHTHFQRTNELWVINEISAQFDGTNGGSTVTFYNAGQNDQWSDYRKDAFSAHFMNKASAMAFNPNGGFANTLDVQDANNNPNGYFSGCTLWDPDTSIYARVNQSGPQLGSHWDMLHQSPFSVGIAGQADNIYWLFDGFHETIVKYDFQDPHPDHEHGGENHSDGLIYRYDQVQVQRVPGLSSHIDIDESNGWLYICDTGNQRIIRLNTNSGEIGQNLNPYGENIAGYYSMVGAEFEVVIDEALTQPTGLDVHNGRLLVSDFTTGEVIIFDIESNPIVELGRIETGFYNEVMGIKVGPDGSIWFVNSNSSELHQLISTFMGDTNGDHVYNQSDYLMVTLFLMGQSQIENPEAADMNFDGTINIFDLIMIYDFLNP